jgi:hypothetical protein
MDTPGPAFGKVLYNGRMILQPGQPYNSGVASDSMPQLYAVISNDQALHKRSQMEWYCETLKI